MKPSLLEIGITVGEIDGYQVCISSKKRLICDCLRYRNKMDKEMLNKAVQNYIADPGKSIPKLLEYVEKLCVKKTAKDLEYTGAVEPPVRRTGNRESGHMETDIYETKPLPQRY